MGPKLQKDRFIKTLTFWKVFCWWKSIETDQLLLSDRFLKFEIALKTDPDIPKKLWYYFEGNMTFSYFVSFVFIDLVDQCGYITWRAFISNYPSPSTWFPSSSFNSRRSCFDSKFEKVNFSLWAFFVWGFLTFGYFCKLWGEVYGLLMACLDIIPQIYYLGCPLCPIMWIT